MVRTDSPLAKLLRAAQAGRTGVFLAGKASTEIYVYLKEGNVAWAAASDRPFADKVRRMAGINPQQYVEIVVHCQRMRVSFFDTLILHFGISEETAVTLVRSQLAETMLTLVQLIDADSVFLPRAFEAHNYNTSFSLQEPLNEEHLGAASF